MNIKEFQTNELKKKFCANGPILNKEKHFYIDPSEWNTMKIVNSIRRNYYPLLIAPSQSGKTTRIYRLQAQLMENKSYQFTPIYLDLLKIVPGDDNRFFFRFIQYFIQATNILNLSDKLQMSDFFEFYSKYSGNHYFELMKKSNEKFNNSYSFGDGCQYFYCLFSKEFGEKFYKKKSFVLFLDELDCISKLEIKTRLEFLSMLRVLKSEQREEIYLNSLFSVVGITNYVGEYLESTLGNSPFNIQNKILAPYFTKEEVSQLFKQYEDQEKIKIDSSIIENIYSQTQGAQGLTTLIGACLDEFRVRGQLNTTNWLNYSCSNEIFKYAELNSANLKKMLSTISDDKNLIPSLLRILCGVEEKYVKNKSHFDALIKCNIIKENKGNYVVASPFIKKFLLYFISKHESKPFIEIPFQNEKLDVLSLITSIIENFDVKNLITGEKLKSNQCNKKIRTGCKEDVYKDEFKRSLLSLLSRKSCVLYYY